MLEMHIPFVVLCKHFMVHPVKAGSESHCDVYFLVDAEFHMYIKRALYLSVKRRIAVEYLCFRD